ncbi:ABC transporter ATP-binding protein [Taklimakanibacter lacteus]|uniref:ABC transporter ATP-binding protein n=1 Tax=Taklimakanibacter lacteus TaxID=2268456 RepID=UPI0034D42C3E
MASPHSSGSAVSLEGVSKAYGRVRALANLTFNVGEGQFFALFGPSSVGKTTTLRTIAGLVMPDEGRVALHGVDVTRAPIKSRGVSMVFQSFALYPHLTVYENFAYPLREARVSGPEIDKRVKETAEMLKLGHRLERKPNTLSGGEQQRVALGRSLIRRPNILLLDEPLTNLDAKLRHDMRAELKRLHRQFGMTIIYATPDELEALSMGEEIAVMRDGAVVQKGSPDELYEKPANVYVAAKIGAPHMNLIDATVGEGGKMLKTGFGSFDLSRQVGARAGDKVVMGVRPADLDIAPAASADISIPVQLLEPLGDVTVVSLGEKSDHLRILLPESRASEIKLGDRLPIKVDARKIHVFSAEDGLALR